MLKSLFYLLLLMGSNFAFGHGEDKPGPNGGFIRMPGAFHTELVPVEKNQLKVFLSDMEFANPTLLNSKVELELAGKISQKANCMGHQTHYLCSFKKDVDLNQPGKLIVRSQRMGQKGMDMTYDLPLSLKKSEAAKEDKEEDHHHHH